ncbi:hypothetical protein NPIL_209661 [Nephila pilipes]|uniref:Defensin n=1 Tax=Nephila pilipes TaxID=299642 RepID=A0A8X6INP0_NEPPI|nr:hypothetical protein NPIL_209661 [Nephila pilipes]
MLSLDTQQLTRPSAVFKDLYRNSTCRFEFTSQSALTTPRSSFESSFEASVAQEFLDYFGDVDGEVDIVQDNPQCDRACFRKCRHSGKGGGSCFLRGYCECFYT